MADSSVSAGDFSMKAFSPKMSSLKDVKGNHIATFASVGSAVQQNVLETILFSDTELLTEERLNTLYCDIYYKRKLKALAFEITQVYQDIIENFIEEARDRGELLLGLKGEIFSIDSSFAVIAPTTPFYALGAPSEVLIGALSASVQSLEDPDTELVGPQIQKLLVGAFVIAKQYFQSSVIPPYEYVVQKGKPHEPFLKVLS